MECKSGLRGRGRVNVLGPLGPACLDPNISGFFHVITRVAYRHPGAPYYTSMEKLKLETSPIFRVETPVMLYGCHLCLGHGALDHDQKASKIRSVD
jgi:hypothetical protein